MRVEVDRIDKSYAGTHALRGVSLVIESGAVHGLVGENGAGKSTLGKIVAGIVRPSAGRLLIDGSEVAFMVPHAALERGITIVQQELALVPALNVAQNVFLGREPHGRLGLLDEKALQAAFADLARAHEFEVDGRRQVADLSIAERQEVEILKAVGRGSRLIVLDEPTSSLTPREVERLHRAIRRLQAEEGTTFVYVSHFLEHVLEVCDSISVLRNGRHVRTGPTAAETQHSIAEAMLGRELARIFPAKVDPARQAPRLRVVGLTRKPDFLDVGLEVFPGEIVGLAGLVGSGRTEVVRAILGAERVDSGSVSVDGRTLDLRHPADAIDAGIAMVPESRRDQGLLMSRSIVENIALVNFAADRALGWIARGPERAKTATAIGRLNVKCGSMDDVVSQLSGGNQQKVLFAKWIESRPAVLILDEPTRGVDIGAKVEIYSVVARLAADGVAILIVSSEIEEIIGLCHRAHVMRQGRIVATFAQESMTFEAILRASLAVGATADAITEAAVGRH